MPNWIANRLPKFTIGNLLLLTTALACGLAVGLTRSADPDHWFPVLERSYKWTDSLLYSGGFLLAFEMLRQANTLRREQFEINTETRFALRLAIGQRLLLALLIVVLIFLKLLINRGTILNSERDENLLITYNQFTDILAPLVLIAVVRSLLNRKLSHKQPSAINRVADVCVYVCLAAVILWLVTDQTTIAALVHLAIEGIERYQAIQWQRPDVYPNHLSENYASFWNSCYAVLAVFVTAGLIWWDASVHRRGWRIVSRLLFVGLIAGLAYYQYWFVQAEFPRISPELANAGFAATTFEFLCGLFLLASLAVIFGQFLAGRKSQNRQPLPFSLLRSGVMNVAAYLLLLSVGAHICLLAYSFGGLSYLGDFLAYGIDTPNVVWSIVVGFVEMISYEPEITIQFLFFISLATLAWQMKRQPEVVLELRPIQASHFCYYTLMSLALLLVAIPTFAAFGFCYWLGPWVLAH